MNVFFSPLIIIIIDEGDVETFTGNTTHADNFKLLVQDGDSLLVGARLVIFSIFTHKSGLSPLFFIFLVFLDYIYL